MQMISRYWRVCLIFVEKKNVEATPETVADKIMIAVALPGSIYPIDDKLWSNTAMYDEIVPYENVIAKTIFMYYLFLKSFASVSV